MSTTPFSFTRKFTSNKPDYTIVKASAMLAEVTSSDSDYFQAKKQSIGQGYTRNGMGVGGSATGINKYTRYSTTKVDAPGGFFGDVSVSDPIDVGGGLRQVTISGSTTVDDSYIYPNAAGGTTYYASFSFRIENSSGSHTEPIPGVNAGLYPFIPTLHKVLYNTNTDQLLVYASQVQAYPRPEDTLILHARLDGVTKTSVPLADGWIGGFETRAPIVFDGPFAGGGLLGKLTLYFTRAASAQQTPEVDYPLNPFIVVDAAPHFKGGNTIDNNPGNVRVRGLARVNRTFGFNSLPDHYELNIPKFSDYIFIPEWFAGGGVIKVMAMDSNRKVLSGVNVRNYDESIRTTNQQQFLPDTTPVYGTFANDNGGILNNWYIYPALSSPLKNRMYPTTLYMPDDSGRLLVFNQATLKYELYKINHHDKNKGYALMFADIWESPFFAARIGLLLNGFLISTAWELESDNKTFKAWAKTSSDGGATWYAPQLMFTRVDDPDTDKFDSFQPTWGIVEAVTTGVLTFGNYKSNDMGATWN